jgi:hypothetical protein
MPCYELVVAIPDNLILIQTHMIVNAAPQQQFIFAEDMVSSYTDRLLLDPGVPLCALVGTNVPPTPAGSCAMSRCSHRGPRPAGLQHRNDRPAVA